MKSNIIKQVEKYNKINLIDIEKQSIKVKIHSYF